MSMYFLHFSCARKYDGIFFAASFPQEVIAPSSMAMPLAYSPEEEGELRGTQRTSLTEIVIMSHAHWLEIRAWAAATIALFGLCGMLIGGCASTAVQTRWADPQFAGRSLRGATVLVVCNASAAAIQRIWP